MCAFCVCSLQGETLGEVKEGEEGVSSAADWVKRSRVKQTQIQEERRLAARRARCVCARAEEVCCMPTGMVPMPSITNSHPGHYTGNSCNRQDHIT